MCVFVKAKFKIFFRNRREEFNSKLKGLLTLNLVFLFCESELFFIVGI